MDDWTEHWPISSSGLSNSVSSCFCFGIPYAGLPYGQNGQLPRAQGGPAHAEGVIENQRKRGKEKKVKKKKEKGQKRGKRGKKK